MLSGKSMQLQFVTAIFIIPIVTFSLIGEWRIVSALVSLDSAREKITASLEPSTSWERTAQEQDIEKASKTLSSLSERMHTHHSMHYEAGRAQLLLALKASDSTESLKRFCSAREHFFRASRNNPLHPVYHISIADIESLSPLLASSCDSENGSTASKHTVPERLSLVSELAPVDLTSIYRSAIIYNHIGQRELALATFRKYQELSPTTSSHIRDQLVRMPVNENELSLIIPKKYPDIHHWINAFKNNRPEEFRYYEHVFQKIISEIIELELNNLSLGQIEKEKFIKMLQSLGSHEVTIKNPNLHSRIYTLLSEHFTSINSKFANGEFAARVSSLYANSRRIPVAKSFDFSRKSPSTGMLYNWHHDMSKTSVQLNFKADHLGFFAPAPDQISLITIAGAPGQIIPDSVKIKLWTSPDNMTFSPYPGELEFNHGEMMGRPLLYILLPQPPGQYNKLYFEAGNTLGGIISNTAGELLQVFTKHTGEK